MQLRRSARVRRGGHLAGSIVAALTCVACSPAGADGVPLPSTPSEVAEPVAESSIELRLKLPGRPLRADELASELRVVLTNVSAEPIRIVRPGDGSHAGWRPPAIGWSVLPGDSTEPRPSTPPTTTSARCGNRNALREEEILELGVGASVEFETWLSPPDLDPGTYRIAFHYRNDPLAALEGLPLGSDVDPSRLRATTRCEAWSQEILVSVLE